MRNPVHTGPVVGGPVIGNRPQAGGPVDTFRGHAHFGGRDRFRAYHHARPGTWTWNRAWYPGWYSVGIGFPYFAWVNTPAGYCQCTAFNQDLEPYSGVALTWEEAAYSAMAECGDTEFSDNGCYVPDNYCQFRQ